MKIFSRKIKSGLTGAAVSILVISSLLSAQESIQPRRLVDVHTAGVLPKSHYDIECRFYPAGYTGYQSGTLMGLNVGLTDRFTVGLSYGGEGIIGRRGNARGNPAPGILVKYRLFEERYALPALALGYDHQGSSGMANAGMFGYDGYVFKSPGFFAALSKNYIMLNIIQIGLHGAGNYSLEGRDSISWPNAMGGVDITINDELTLVAEYDCAFNDRTGSKDKYFSPFNGFFNLGIRWAFSHNFALQFDAKDIFEKKLYTAGWSGGERVKRPLGWSREIRVLHYSQF
ncbi:MAG: hypothetical protein FWE57_08515 [Chitinispirillia bacterium]|nr:hypothetical protein [Chitinispirillia bacterium]